MRRLILGAFLTTIFAAPAAPAAAVEKTVGFHPKDYIYIPERVAVKPGDSVKWSNTGSEDPHNVRFEDGQFTEPVQTSHTFTTPPRTFTANGAYRYFCEQHGRDVMKGVVYVNETATLPANVQIRVAPNPAVAGTPVAFDAALTTKGDNEIAKYEWDLNGDGLYERNTGLTPNTSETYIAPRENLIARLKVTDSTGISDVQEIAVNIKAPPPAPAPQPQPQPQPAPQPAPAPAPTPQPPPAPSTSTSTGTTPSAPAPPRSFSYNAASTASRVKGAAARVTCSGRCRITATLSISKTVARRARLGSKRAVTIGTARGTLTSAGSKTVKVKLTSKARSRLAKFKTVKATLKLAVTNASGKTTRKQKTISLKR